MFTGVLDSLQGFFKKNFTDSRQKRIKKTEYREREDIVYLLSDWDA